VVIFDLDYTVYDNDPRMLQVLKEWAARPEATGRFPVESRMIGALPPDKIRYFARDSVREAGLDDTQTAAVMTDLLPFSRSRFLDNDHTLIDPLIPGVRDLIQALVRAGAKVVFLTGRTEAEQGAATRAALARDGMAEDGEHYFLYMKPSGTKSDGSPFTDEEFKRGRAGDIDKLGDVVATLDNEPVNVVTYTAMYPRAMNIFVNTRWSNKVTLPGSGVYRIDHYVAPA